MIKPNFVFRGSQKSPFLAPRGLFVCKNIMVVCDTAHNRVFIWTTIPKNEYQEPDVILGTQKEEVSATTFYYPSGVWTDGKKLIVADAWNHRVLIWNAFPTENYQPADVVLGQATFTDNLPNASNLNSSCKANSLYWCYGVFSDGNSIWVADTGNRRILYFKNFPAKNGENANEVIGQEDFESKNFNPNFSTWPYSVKISETGEMLVSDTQCYRVHFWGNWEDAITNKATILIGQENFENSGQNQFKMKPNSSTLNWVYDAVFSKNNSIVVADTGNCRVLQWNTIPTSNNAPADKIFGQLGFDEIGENKESIMGFDDYLYWPFSVSYSENILFVCETGNNRIYFYEF